MKSKEATLAYNTHKRVTVDHFYLKVSERFTSGLPDSLFINKKGLHLWVEYKIFPNTLSELQKAMINLLVQYNQTVWIITKTENTYTIFDAKDRSYTASDKPWEDISNWLSS